MNRKAAIAFIFLGALMVVVSGAMARYPGRASVKLPASACDEALWNRVYEKDRLKVIEPCTVVEGQVDSVHINEDGDAHINLAVEDRQLLNLMNVTHNKSRLVAEVVCDHMAKAPPASATCAGYKSATVLPKPGDRVRITGSYVTDTGNNWREIHPVSKIEVVR